MRRTGFAPLVFLAWPILEIVAFVEVGGAIGALATVALVIAAALAGLALIRSSGMRLIDGLRRDLAAGRAPERALVGGTFTAIAGLLLIVPGFVSDLAGLLLLLPPVQRLVAARLAASVTVVGGEAFRGPARRDGVVDLDPDDFSRRPDPSTPWRGGGEPPAIDGR
jgi:UPF0716 protein FxsA